MIRSAEQDLAEAFDDDDEAFADDPNDDSLYAEEARAAVAIETQCRRWLVQRRLAANAAKRRSDAASWEERVAQEIALVQAHWGKLAASVKEGARFRFGCLECRMCGVSFENADDAAVHFKSVEHRTTGLDFIGFEQKVRDGAKAFAEVGASRERLAAHKPAGQGQADEKMVKLGDAERFCAEAKRIENLLQSLNWRDAGQIITVQLPDVLPFCEATRAWFEDVTAAATAPPAGEEDDDWIPAKSVPQSSSKAKKKKQSRTPRKQLRGNIAKEVAERRKSGRFDVLDLDD